MANRTSMDNMAVQLEDIAKDITGTPIAKGGYAWDIIDNAVTTIAEAVGAEVPEKKFSTKKDRVAALVNAIADADVSGGGGSAETEAAIIMGTLSGVYENSAVTYIPSSAFENFSGLTAVDFAACTSIGEYAFRSCTELATASFSVCTNINMGAFMSCTRLTSINFPACKSIKDHAFSNCTSLAQVNIPCNSIAFGAFNGCINLTTASFPECTDISTGAFMSCFNLLSLYLGGSSYVSLGMGAFGSTPIGGYTESTGGVYGSIFVPASMIDTYKTMSGWSSYAERFAVYEPEE